MVGFGRWRLRSGERMRGVSDEAGVTIAEFLLARIAEDEDEARRASICSPGRAARCADRVHVSPAAACDALGVSQPRT